MFLRRNSYYPNESISIVSKFLDSNRILNTKQKETKRLKNETKRKTIVSWR